MPTRIPKPKPIELVISKILVLTGIYSCIIFLSWLLSNSLRQYNIIYYLILIAFSYKIFSLIIEWLFIWHPSVPKKPIWTTKHSVDVLTTYVQGEPKDMVKQSLIAIKSMTYPHETFLCDEADDPELKQFCQLHNIHHVTREKKINAKAGNINNALETVAKGDIALILDPDHIVYPNFLDEVLPFFEDEEIGFVQVVQAYYNQYETVIAKAAAEQTYQFYGPLMMTLNSYGATPAIGANCTFRRKALDSIGGHAPGLTEDLHTTLKLNAKGWKSVYNPVIVAKGLVPWNYSGYCLQQQKWSRGTFDLLFNVFPKVANKISWTQRLAFLAVPFFYLSGVMALIDFFLPIIALLLGKVPVNLNVFEFLIYYFQLYFMSQIIRFYHQKWYYEKHEKGTAMLSGILFRVSWWAPFLGFIFSLIKKNIPYIPTPKDSTLETPWKLLLPNFLIIALSLFAIIYGLINDFTPFSIFMAFLALLNILMLSFGTLMAMQKQIVFFHQLFQGSFISKNSSTRKFVFKIKYLLYNFLHTNFVVVSAILLIFLFNIATFKISPSRLPYYLSSKYIGQKISNIIGEKNTLKEYTLIDNKDYGQVYFGENHHKNMSYNKIPVSFIKANFSLNTENKLLVEHFLDSCYTNNILPFLSLSIDTTNEKSIQVDNQILTIEHIYKEIKSRYFPVIIMFDRSKNNVSDEMYSDVYNSAYLMADSMAINTMITWVWHTNKIINDKYLAYYYETRRVDWIYSKDASAFNYNNNYYGNTNEDLRLPLLVNHSNVKNLVKSNFEKNVHVRNVVGILGTTSNKLNYNIKEVFKKPDIQEVNRLEPPNYIKGVAYTLGHNESATLPLTQKKLTHDFKLIDEMGCNAIRRFSPSIYDYNMLRALKKFDLDVLYGFWFDITTNYYADSTILQKHKDEVIRLVEKYKTNSTISCWGLGNETWTYLNINFGQPYLSVVRNSYLRFINDLATEIKLVDHQRPIFPTIIQGSASMYAYSENVNSIDFLGINSYYEENISRLKEMAQRNLNGMPYLVSEYGNKGHWSEEFNDFDNNNRILEQSSMQKARDYEKNWNKYILADKQNNVGGVAFSWQDRNDFTATWFGIIDIYGNKKPAYYALRDAYSNNPQNDWACKFPLHEFDIFINYDKYVDNKIYAKAKVTTKIESELNNYQFKWFIYTDVSLDKIKETEFEFGKTTFSCTIPNDNRQYRIYLYVKDESGNVITESYPIGDNP